MSRDTKDWRDALLYCLFWCVIASVLAWIGMDPWEFLTVAALVVACGADGRGR